MRTFAEQLFTHFGATVRPHPHRSDELIVTLPPELIDQFGKSTLYLRIPNEQEPTPILSPEEDLLIYGSTIFEKILSLLAGKGTAVHWQIPAPSPELIPHNPPFPFPLDNCTLQKWDNHYQSDPFFIFNFRVRFSSDEQHERIKSIALDSNGKENNQISSYFTHHLLTTKIGHQFPYPSNKKKEMFHQAETYLNEYINSEIKKIEKEIAPRREKRFRTLNNYYQRLIENIKIESDSYEHSRQQLIDDLTYKINEEQERYQLYIETTPISYAVLSIPAIIHETTLATNHSEQKRRIIHPLHETKAIPHPCHHCHDPVDTISLCDHNHLIHHHCFESCTSCKLDICFSCGIERCAISDELTCANCTANCAYCDRWLQKNVIDQCAICTQPFCPNHQIKCSWCAQIYCQNCQTDQGCHTCQTALNSLKRVNNPPISKFGYQWKKGENGRFTIYIAFGSSLLRLFLRPLILVYDQEGNEILYKKGSWFQK